MDLINETPFRVAWREGAIRHPRPSVTFIVKGTLDLKPESVAVPAAEQLYPTGGSSGYPDDFAYFKPRVDLLLVGTCCAPEGKPRPSCPIAFGVGSWSKRLIVLGERSRIGSAISDPTLFVRLPLATASEPGSVLRVQYPDRSDFAPTAFGPVPISVRPPSGTYDETWLRERWPWFPVDFDWRFFNAAPEDQQLESPLRGDEALFFENLHPEHSRYESRLPGYRVRLFLTELVRASERFLEVPMALDTVWVDAEHGKLVLVWRGNVHAPLDGCIRSFVVSEPVESDPRAIEYYRRRQQAHLADRKEQEEAKWAPEAPRRTWKPRGSVPSGEDVSSDFREAEKECEEAEREAIAALGARKPSPPEPLAFRKEIREALEEARRRLAKAGRTCPPSLMAKLEAVPELEEEPPPRAPLPARGRDDFSGADLAGADLRGRDLRRAILTNARLRGAKLDGADLTEADLGGADLSEASARGAILKGADLDRAVLRSADCTEADLSGAVLTRADLTETRLARATAVGATMREADLTCANLDGATLDRADLAGAILHRTSLRTASLKRASLIGAWGRGVAAPDADLSELRATKSSLPDGDFSRASANGSIWDEGRFSGCDFTRAKLEKAEFSQALLTDAKFESANLRSARFVESSLGHAFLRRANLFRTNLEGADARGADLRLANLYGAELRKTRLDGALLEGANLRRTKLIGGAK